MRKSGLLIRGAFVLVPFLVVIVILAAKKTPEKELANARLALSEARAENANIYSKELFENANKQYNNALQAWQEENNKLIILRDYRKAKQLATEASEYANSSMEMALEASADFDKRLKERLTLIRKLIDDNQEGFLKLPGERALRDDNNKGLKLYAEAERAFKEKRYTLCDEKLKESNRLLQSSFKRAGESMEEYLEMWPQWDRWVKESIQTSKKRKVKILIVDKYARTCYLYSNGSVAKEFSIDLGSNWVGDKMEKGDKATPEGVYHITAMKKGAQTSFYKALLIDYPNGDDKMRFNKNKQSGLIKMDAEIGSLIEIHGKGGTGTDWTDGCIALSNSDMDKLFSLCSVGTMVTIVGSILGPEEILK